MTLHTPLPAEIHLNGPGGESATLRASGVLIGDCQSCKLRCLALSHCGQMRCTHCGGPVKWAWTTPQIGFLPEGEAEFMGWDRGRQPAEDRAKK